VSPTVIVESAGAVTTGAVVSRTRTTMTPPVEPVDEDSVNAALKSADPEVQLPV
jgi:hypothetical protein